MFLDGGSEGRETKGWNLCSPKSVIESQKRADAWERIWRSDDGSGLFKYRRWSEWLRENMGESIIRLTDTSSRTRRISERPSRRAAATVCPIHTVGGGRRGLVPTVRSSQGGGKGIQRGDERAEGAPDGTTFHVGVCSVRPWPSDGESWSDRAAEVEVEWLNQFRKQLITASDVGWFLEMWNIRETHPVRYRMRTPDPALPEDAQNINKLAHILRKVLLHRKETEQEGPAPPTNNERKIHSQLEHRRKRAQGKYIQWKTRLTSTKLTWRNRWQSGVSEMTMKSTRPSNEFFSLMHAGYQDASGDSVVGMPESTVLTVFSPLLRTLWLETVSIVLEVDQSLPNMALCLRHQCRVRPFSLLGPHELTVNRN